MDCLVDAVEECVPDNRETWSSKQLPPRTLPAVPLSLLSVTQQETWDPEAQVLPPPLDEPDSVGRARTVAAVAKMVKMVNCIFADWSEWI